MYLARDNAFMLHAHFGSVQERLLRVLLALNRQYFFGFKWIDVVLAQLIIAPHDFRRRWKRVGGLPPEQAAHELSDLVDEVYDLLERHVPDLGSAYVARLRRSFHYRRPLWEPLWEDRPPLGGFTKPPQRAR